MISHNTTGTMCAMLRHSATTQLTTSCASVDTKVYHGKAQTTSRRYLLQYQLMFIYKYSAAIFFVLKASSNMPRPKRFGVLSARRLIHLEWGIGSTRAQFTSTLIPMLITLRLHKRFNRKNIQLFKWLDGNMHMMLLHYLLTMTSLIQ